nr:uncharacterized protein LOC116280005 [Vicugna pacos]
MPCAPTGSQEICWTQQNWEVSKFALNCAPFALQPRCLPPLGTLDPAFPLAHLTYSWFLMLFLGAIFWIIKSFGLASQCLSPKERIPDTKDSPGKHSVYFIRWDPSPQSPPGDSAPAWGHRANLHCPRLSPLGCEAAFDQAATETGAYTRGHLLLSPSCSCPPSRREAWARARLAGGRDIWLHANGHLASAARWAQVSTTQIRCQGNRIRRAASSAGRRDGVGEGRGCGYRHWPSSWEPPPPVQTLEAPGALFSGLFLNKTKQNKTEKQGFHSPWVMLPLVLRARGVQDIQAETDHKGFTMCG